MLVKVYAPLALAALSFAAVMSTPSPSAAMMQGSIKARTHMNGQMHDATDMMAGEKRDAAMMGGQEDHGRVEMAARQLPGGPGGPSGHGDHSGPGGDSGDGSGGPGGPGGSGWGGFPWEAHNSHEGGHSQM